MSNLKFALLIGLIKFALLMGLIGFIGSFLPINFSWIFIGVIVASAINGAMVEGSKGTDTDEFDNHDWE